MFGKNKLPLGVQLLLLAVIGLGIWILSTDWGR